MLDRRVGGNMNLATNFPPAYGGRMREAGHWRGRLALDDFDAALQQWPDHPAVIDSNSMTGRRTALTYRDLNDRVGRIARGLLRLGVARGDVVSLQLPNWWQIPALHLACLRIGAVTNALMPIFRERELRFMLALVDSKILNVPREFRGFDHAAMADAMRSDLPALGHLLVIGEGGTRDFDAALLTEPATDADRAIFDERRLHPEEIVQLCFTSGTTGEPKGVLHTSDTLLSNSIPFAERLRLTHDDVLLMPSPLAHQTGFMLAMLPSFHIGGTLVLQDVWNPARAAAMICAERVTFSMGATPFLADLTAQAEQEPDAFATLRIFGSAGAPIPRALVGRAGKAMGAQILSCWGMSEVGGATLTRPEDPPEKASGTDGACLPGVEIRVLDAEGRELPPNTEGRLEVRACSMFCGYHKRPNLPAMNAEGWFDTGDMARIDDDGYLRITGRAKDIIIRGGENVPVIEIENLLFRHPAVQEVAIVAMPDPRLGERACAYVVPKPGVEPNLQELCQFLIEQGTAKTYLPERLELLEAMPRTPTGKIQKFRLREAAAATRG
jgi:cyclohexanecarboxylate-CoA ligase